MLNYDYQSDDEVHYDNACVSLDTSGAVPAEEAVGVRPEIGRGDPSRSR